MALTPGIRLGGYEVTALIGHGGITDTARMIRMARGE